jgi:transmembrane sensor
MSETTPHDPLKLKRYREAAEWVLQLNAPDAAEEDMDGWLQWCEADDDNLAAFEQLQRDWQDTQGFKTAPELLSCVDEPQSIRREAVPPNSKGRLWERRSVRWAVAVSGALIVVLSLQWWTQRPVYQVASAPNQEPATLPDGSSLLLSAKAIADVDFSGVTRRVALRPGGEAYIKVHHDKTRPFTVSAGAMTVTAVGTAFDVRREADRVKKAL